MKALPTPTRLAALYRSLSRLVSAGIPPAQAALALEDGGPGGLPLAGALAAALRKGSSFAHAARDAGVPEAHVAALEAAEISGTLDTVLAQLAASLEVEAALRREAMSLFLRPGIILLACAFISPLPSLVTGGAASYIRAALLPLILIAAGSTLGGMIFDALRSGRRSFVSALPSIADLVMLAARSRACRMAGVLLGAGLPMPRSIRLAGAVGGDIVAPAFQRAARDVETGARLSDALKRAHALEGVPASCAVEGEITGRLDRAFPEAALIMEEELASRLRWRVRIASGVAYLLAGGFVAFQVFKTFGQIGQLAE